MAKTSHESDRFMLRLPEGMRDKIKQSAEHNNRSMNAEIVARLEGSYKNSKTASELFEVFLEQLKEVDGA